VVHFDEVTSIYPAGTEADNNDPQHLQGTLRGEPTEEEYSGHEYEDHNPSKRCCYSMSVLLEKPWVTQFFRICAVLNLLSLACSSPWRVCSGSSEDERSDCEGVFYQYVVIASVDFIVSIVYTVQLIFVIQSVLFHRFWEKKGHVSLVYSYFDRQEYFYCKVVALMRLTSITWTQAFLANIQNSQLGAGLGLFMSHDPLIGFASHSARFVRPASSMITIPESMSRFVAWDQSM